MTELQQKPFSKDEMDIISSYYYKSVKDKGLSVFDSQYVNKMLDDFEAELINKWQGN